MKFREQQAEYEAMMERRESRRIKEAEDREEMGKRRINLYLRGAGNARI